MITTAVLLAMALDMTSLHQEVLADAQRRSGVDAAGSVSSTAKR
jgi:hypothetical protein